MYIIPTKKETRSMRESGRGKGKKKIENERK
jgi:hypothetical protein